MDSRSVTMRIADLEDEVDKLRNYAFLLQKQINSIRRLAQEGSKVAEVNETLTAKN